MRSLWITAALLLGFSLAGTAGAAEYHARGHSEHTIVRHAPAARPYYLENGRPWHGSYYFPGREHHHWAYQVWYPAGNCYHYWDADLGRFFYYDTGLGGYYPCP